MNIADKIAKIEALMASTHSEGERLAAEFLKQRLQEKEKGKVADKPIEYTVSSRSMWEKKLFLAICNKHGLKPYRYWRQKHTTTMVRSTKSFMESILWPEYMKYSKMFSPLVDEVLGDLISKIHQGESDETVIVGEIPTTGMSIEQ